MMEIEGVSSDPDAPYANLLPIVWILEQNGNSAIVGGFAMTRDEWVCRMANSIDFELLMRTIVLPANIKMGGGHDTILDQLTWCVIHGPGKR